jgi:hypothetical protein
MDFKEKSLKVKEALIYFLGKDFYDFLKDNNIFLGGSFSSHVFFCKDDENLINFIKENVNDIDLYGYKKDLSSLLDKLIEMENNDEIILTKSLANIFNFKFLNKNNLKDKEEVNLNIKDEDDEDEEKKLNIKDKKHKNLEIQVILAYLNENESFKDILREYDSNINELGFSFKEEKLIYTKNFSVKALKLNYFYINKKLCSPERFEKIKKRIKLLIGNDVKIRMLYTKESSLHQQHYENNFNIRKYNHITEYKKFMDGYILIGDDKFELDKELRIKSHKKLFTILNKNTSSKEEYLDQENEENKRVVSSSSNEDDEEYTKKKNNTNDEEENIKIKNKTHTKIKKIDTDDEEEYIKIKKVDTDDEEENIKIKKVDTDDEEKDIKKKIDSSSDDEEE